MDKLPFKILKQIKYDVTFFEDDFYFVCTMSVSMLAAFAHVCVHVCEYVLVFLLVSLTFLKNKTIFKTEKANLAVSKQKISLGAVKIKDAK